MNVANTQVPRCLNKPKTLAIARDQITHIHTGASAMQQLEAWPVYLN